MFKRKQKKKKKTQKQNPQKNLKKPTLKSFKSFLLKWTKERTYNND